MLTAALLVLFATSAWATPEPKTVGGTNAPAGFFPYMVSIRDEFKRHKCGGTILTPTAILTTTDCIEEFQNISEQITVFAGSQTLDGDGQTVGVSKVILNGGYDSNDVGSQARLNDVGILQLSRSLVFGKTVTQIALAPQNFVLPKGAYATLAGWGANTLAGTAFNDLQVVQYLKVDQTIGTSYALTSDELDRGLCGGDYGGPLIYGGVQVGIGSLIFYDCSTTIPSYFTDVAKVLPWIQNNLGADKSNLLIGTIL